MTWQACTGMRALSFRRYGTVIADGGGRATQCVASIGPNPQMALGRQSGIGRIRRAMMADSLWTTYDRLAYLLARRKSETFGVSI